MKKKDKSLQLFILVFVVSLVLDILSKQIIYLTKFTTTGHFVDISNLFNAGTLWGLFSSVTFVNIIFIFVSIVALSALFYFRKEYSKLNIPLALISAGIFGNLIDRVLYGAVFDWINFHFWPIFNLADTFIVCGVILAIVMLAREELNTKG